MLALVYYRASRLPKARKRRLQVIGHVVSAFQILVHSNYMHSRHSPNNPNNSYQATPAHDRNAFNKAMHFHKIFPGHRNSWGSIQHSSLRISETVPKMKLNLLAGSRESVTHELCVSINKDAKLLACRVASE